MIQSCSQLNLPCLLTDLRYSFSPRTSIIDFLHFLKGLGETEKQCWSKYLFQIKKGTDSSKIEGQHWDNYICRSCFAMVFLRKEFFLITGILKYLWFQIIVQPQKLHLPDVKSLWFKPVHCLESRVKVAAFQSFYLPLCPGTWVLVIMNQQCFCTSL